MSTEDDVRRIALSLREVSEKPSYGTPGFRVKNVLFARIHEMPAVLVAWRPSVEDRDELIRSNPEKFFTTGHYAGHASVLVRLDAVDPDELEEPLEEAWEARAPARVKKTGPHAP
ncbi:MAG: MmcQ/YjbR family DNA-binding protein [Rhodococcus sp. (in: high G+C Gram-positive bacteria)]